MNPNPILHYKPLDFCNPDEKLLKEYPILKQWREDKHFLFFIESITEKYSVFLFDLYYLEPEDFSKVKIYLIPNSLLCFLERILETNKGLDFNFYFYETENRNNLFYSLAFNIKTKDILIKEEKIALKRADSVFVVFKVWQKKFIVIKENNECLFTSLFSSKTFKISQFRYEILKTYFLKKIQTPISKDLNLLPPFVLSDLKVDFNLLQESYTIQDFVESTLKTKIPFNLNRLDLFTALSFGIFLPLIEERERNKFYQFLLTKNYPKIADENLYSHEQSCDIFYKRKKFNCLNLYYFYLLKTIKSGEKCKYIDESLLKDYTELIYKTKSGINLKIQSIQRIRIEHDLLVEKLNESKIPKNKKLQIHQSFIHLKLPKNFKLLKTERELFLQGKRQNNCVWTRKNKVNEGRSAIYYLNYKGKDYTLEVSKRKEKFTIFEMKGRHNAEPNKEVFSYVERELQRSRVGRFLFKIKFITT